MRQRFTIPGRFPSLNDFLGYDAFKRNKVKREADRRVAEYARIAKIRPCTRPIKYSVLWVEENRRRDLDNVAFGKKFIQDGLIQAGIIKNDSFTYIKGFSDSFAYDSRNPHIEVEITDA